MADFTKHTKYTVADIENYLQQKTSNAERHALEKAALADPFLADALEGFEIADLAKAKNCINTTCQLINAASQKNTTTEHQFTIKDIEQYFAGTLSNTQKHALEKAALADPFLADAMEGFEMANMQTAKNYIANTTQQIQNKEKATAKVITMPTFKKQWLSVAAAIIIMLGAGSTIWWVNKKSANSINENFAKVTEPVNNNNATITEQQKENSTTTIQAPSTKQTTKDIALADVTKKDKATLADKDLSSAAITSPSQGAAALHNEDVITKSDVGVPPSLNVKESAAMVAHNNDAKQMQTKKLAAPTTTDISATTNEALNKGITPVGGWNAFNNYILHNKATWNIQAANTENIEVYFIVNKNGMPEEITTNAKNTTTINRVKELLNNGLKWMITNEAENKVTLKLAL